MFSVQQAGLVITFEFIIQIRNDFPVDQVGAVHNRHAGQQMHGGTCHVVIVAHPDDIRIGNVAVDDRIGSGDYCAGTTGTCTKKYRQQCCQYEVHSIVFHIRG